MSLLDPKWKYTHSTATDIRKTFARVRKEQAQAKKPECTCISGPEVSVETMQNQWMQCPKCRARYGLKEAA